MHSELPVQSTIQGHRSCNQIRSLVWATNYNGQLLMVNNKAMMPFMNYLSIPLKKESKMQN